MKAPGQFKESWRMRAYAGLTRGLHRLLRGTVIPRERAAGADRCLKELSLLPQDERKSRLWFHSASVGELESLWPLIERASRSEKYQLIITVFSSSAYSHLLRHSSRLPQPPLYAGYSPFEGSWSRAIEEVRPAIFITAKYEAWPELWHALGKKTVPLAIIGAKLRSSLQTARRVLRLMNGVVPDLELVTFDEKNVSELHASFPQATVTVDSDPRWDRVFDRTGTRHPRVSDLKTALADLPRPWGILGSVWPEDLERLAGNQGFSLPGTLFFVPHKVDPKSVKEIELRVRDMGWTPLRTAEGLSIRPAGKLAVIVDEMGFLAELYRWGDWAYVGGGFGAGVHSTIEPAVAGLRVGAGPAGAEKFDEITWLQGRSLLRLLRTPSDWDAWRESVVEIPEQSRRDERVRIVEAHRQASDRIWERLAQRLSISREGLRS